MQCINMYGNLGKFAEKAPFSKELSAKPTEDLFKK